MKGYLLSLASYELIQTFDFGIFRTPTVRDGIDYAVAVYDDRISVKRGADKDLGMEQQNISVSGADIAKEMERSFSHHGIVALEGPIPSDAELERARAARHAWYLTQFAEAQDNWTRYRQYRNITDRQRDAARYLFAKGMIAEAPAWLDVTGIQPTKQECPACGETIKIGVAKCAKCGAILDVEKATRFGLIPPAMPAPPTTAEPVRAKGK